jgi:hypothetical protein
LNHQQKNELVIVQAPWKKFKLIFNRNPVVGEIVLPTSLKKYISNAQVRKVFVKE